MKVMMESFSIMLGNNTSLLEPGISFSMYRILSLSPSLLLFHSPLSLRFFLERGGTNKRGRGKIGQRREGG